MMRDTHNPENVTESTAQAIERWKTAFSDHLFGRADS